MADSETLANFLDVSQSKIPANPEAVSGAKLAMVNLARTSQRQDIQEDMLPRPSSGRVVGLAYTSHLIDTPELVPKMVKHSHLSGRWPLTNLTDAHH